MMQTRQGMTAKPVPVDGSHHIAHSFHWEPLSVPCVVSPFPIM